MFFLLMLHVQALLSMSITGYSLTIRFSLNENLASHSTHCCLHARQAVYSYVGKLAWKLLLFQSCALGNYSILYLCT